MLGELNILQKMVFQDADSLFQGIDLGEDKS
jgi:hypothetical protein